MAVASLIIAILSFLFMAFIYFRYDKKLKEQERILNMYQIEKMQKETVDQQRAEVRASIAKMSNSGLGIGPYCGTLIIKNYGKGTAWRVFIRSLSHGHDRINLPVLTNEDLLPGEQKEYSVNLGLGCGKTDVQLSWTDDSGERQERKCSLCQ